MVKNKLSVVLATRNEEKNIGSCLESVRQLADEIIVVDEVSTDKTREIAQKYGAKVFTVKHNEIFHKTKQIALDKATGDWILQLDADEKVTRELAGEIKKVIELSGSQVTKYQNTQKSKLSKLYKLFSKHQKLIVKREGKLGTKNGEVVAYFIPRLNYFLGTPLKYAGTYPDGVIRLIKRGKARFPCKSVHELMEVDGKVTWLYNNLEHHDSPTFYRYLQRANRYTDLIAKELKKSDIPANLLFLIHYSFSKIARQADKSAR